jgi:hypothetical protein
MKNKIIITIGLIWVLVASLVPTNVFAATATTYVSPSSSTVTKGSNVTVQVRINSGTSPMDSVQASLVFDSAKLQYVSYSAGAFTTFQQSVAGGTFSYVGTLLGSSTSGDKSIFSVTFKSLVAGTASLAPSNIGAAYQGTEFTSVSSSGGSVTINNPVVVTVPDDTTDTPTTTTPVTTPTTTTNTDTETEVKDTTAPKLTTTPTVTVTQKTIKLKFSTNEKAKIQTKYTLSKTAKSLSDATLSTAHEITIGSDTALSPGATYKVEIIATDKSGNKATIYTKNIRTTGVEYTVKITDLNGNPLANYPVELHSTPITATTDSEGIAKFADVTPGKHTLVFDIDGLTINQPVSIATDSVGVNAAQTSSDVEAAEVKLPVSLATVAKEVAKNNNPVPFILAEIVFAIVIIALTQLTPVKRAFGWIFGKVKKIIPRRKDTDLPY